MIYEMNGGDPQAAKVKPALMAAVSSDDAYGHFTHGFERPAGAPGSEETNLRSLAHGAFTGPAQDIVGQWRSEIDDARRQYTNDVAGAKDLREAEIAATRRWMVESQSPPPANMHAAWSAWSPIAIGLALLGGIAGRNMTGALGAAGVMMSSATQADTASYDRAYAHWKDNLDVGTKLIGLLHAEGSEIMNAAGKSYEQKLAELRTLGSAYKLQQELNPDSLPNIEKMLQVQHQYQQVITAQNQETEVRNAAAEKDSTWLAAHPEAGGTVPASVHNANIGTARRERSAFGAPGVRGAAVEVEVTDAKGNTKTQLAQQMPNGQWVTADENRTPIEGVTRVVKEGQAQRSRVRR